MRVGLGPPYWDQCPDERYPESSRGPSIHADRGRKKSVTWKRSPGPHEHQPWPSSLQNYKQHVPIAYKPPSLWCFVKAA